MTPTPTESTEALLATAMAEAQRLRLHFAQRSRLEKKRMTQLETLVPKLKNLVKNGQAVTGKITKDEVTLLEWLKTPQVP